MRPGTSSSARGLPGPVVGQDPLDEQQRARGVAPLDGVVVGGEPAQHLGRRPGDRGDRRDAEPLVDDGAARVVDAGDHVGDPVVLPRDARRQDVRVVAVRHRGERAGAARPRRVERLAVESRADDLVPLKSGGSRSNARFERSTTDTVWPWLLELHRDAGADPTASDDDDVHREMSPRWGSCCKAGRTQHRVVGCERGRRRRGRCRRVPPDTVGEHVAEPLDRVPRASAYRLKRFFLGKPLVSEQLQSERLSRPIALGVLAPDCISSSAYGTEQMLTQMTPYIGLAAFSLLVPITLRHLRGAVRRHASATSTSSGSTPRRAGPTSSPATTSARRWPRSPRWRSSSTTRSPSPCRARRAPTRSRARSRVLNGYVLPITFGIVLL